MIPLYSGLSQSPSQILAYGLRFFLRQRRKRFRSILMRARSGIGFWPAAPLMLSISMSEPEGGALVGPGERNPSQQQLDRQGARLAAFDNGLDDVGRKIGKPEQP